MHPNLRHLHTFREVARLGSVSAAARSVHISQPAVTQAIAGLERYFGSPLLLRRSIGVSLTTAGEICLARIERSMRQLREAVNAATRGSGAERADVERMVRSRQLDALGAVVEYGNFSIAARARQVSQPGIHRSARDLERLLGVPLLEKTSFGITPTREAAELARCTRLAFAEIEQARAEVHALSGGESGRTVIAAMPLARSYLLPAALLEFTQEHPRHGVAIIEGTYEHLLAGLRSGESDIVIGALRDPVPAADVLQEHLFDDPLAIIVRARHPLVRCRRVTAAALKKFQWIAPRAGSPLRVHFDALLASTGLELPSPPLECNSLAAARAFLLESDRIMLLSAHQIHYEMQAGLLVALPHPAGNVVRPIGLTLRRNWHPTSTQQRLLEILRRKARAAAASHAVVMPVASLQALDPPQNR
ncbi:MAG TPA: LysR substrate-binding domain-containing protein [Steroidobacteraceae bacterium]|nr:LysR substrate-binding domain-containing protein [Steroidobacteraceae bacterium]